jgi:DNA processing protein
MPDVPSHEHMFDDSSLVSTRERAAVLALVASKEVPTRHLAGLIEEEGSALAVLEQRRQVAANRLFELDDRHVTLDELEDHINGWESEGMSLLTILDAAYPGNLRMVYDRPPVLFIKGSLAATDERSVAVVGTRRASKDGVERAHSLAASLVEANYTVVSGLAAGIDTAAHTGTLDAGGRTVAVIGTGLRESFPKPNAALQARLSKESAVISQFWPGQGPRPWTFPMRNAVMSGFARATAVVEASTRTSGAAMQARLALEHGRPVFLLRSLLSHDWAQAMADRPAVYVVDAADEIVDVLDRLYSDDLTLIA